MVAKNLILIKYYCEGASKSAISRELGISRQVVRKYIREHESLLSSGNLSDALEYGLSTKPTYKSSARQKRKLTTELAEEIYLCVEKNTQKRHQGLHKQLMKKIDIYKYLKEKGFNIGYTTVCNYIGELENKHKECFIKQVYKAGISCEFDWGEVKLKIGGKLQSFNLAVFTSAYSNYRWSKIFNRQDTLAFSQSHIDFFSYIGGVYKEMVYDNMRVVISKFVCRTKKEPTDALLELSNYYKFSYRFCNIRRGNEKGHVERSVELVRRKGFCQADEFQSLEEANKHLLVTCESLNNTNQVQQSKTANELFDHERPHLYQTSVPYRCFKEEHAKVDKYSTIILYKNRYSAPDFLVGKLLDIKVFAEQLILYYNNEQLCIHKRSYGAHTWTMDINHYLRTLIRKPGALKNSLTFKQSGEIIKTIYKRHFTQDNKGFIKLLQYCKDKDLNFTDVEKAIKKLTTHGQSGVNKDTILAIMWKEQEAKTETPATKSTKECDEIEEFAKAGLKAISAMLN